MDTSCGTAWWITALCQAQRCLMARRHSWNCSAAWKKGVWRQRGQDTEVHLQGKQPCYLITTMVSKNSAGVQLKLNWAHLRYLLKNKAEENFVKITATTCVILVVELHSSYSFISLLQKLWMNRKIYHQKAPLISYHRRWSHRQFLLLRFYETKSGYFFKLMEH